MPIVRPVYPNELYHYGVKGMHWGIRRYQPYPKGYSGQGKYLGKRSKIGLFGKKKVVKHLNDEQRAWVINKAPLSDVLAYSDQLTTEERNKAASRIESQRRLKTLRYSGALKAYNDVSTAVGNTSKILNNGLDIWGKGKKIFEGADDKGKVKGIKGLKSWKEYVDKTNIKAIKKGDYDEKMRFTKKGARKYALTYGLLSGASAAGGRLLAGHSKKDAAVVGGAMALTGYAGGRLGAAARNAVISNTDRGPDKESYVLARKQYLRNKKRRR